MQTRAKEDNNGSIKGLFSIMGDDRVLSLSCFF